YLQPDYKAGKKRANTTNILIKEGYERRRERVSRKKYMLEIAEPYIVKTELTNYILMKHINTQIFTRKEISEMNDIFQVDYLPEKKEIRISLPEEVWNSIDTVTLTRLFQEELVVEKQKESEVEHDG